MRASQHATPAYMTARARRLRAEQTDAERILWSELRGCRMTGHRFVRQLVVKPYIADFACRSHRLIVELDGSQHAGSVYDRGRNERLMALGWSVLRFWNEDVLRHREETLETIAAALKGRLHAQDGAGLRYFPAAVAAGEPSPVLIASAMRPPSPETGEGEAPFAQMPTSKRPPSPETGEGPGRGTRASTGAGAPDGPA